MAGSRRPGFSEFEKPEIWQTWRSGKTLKSIGRDAQTLGWNFEVVRRRFALDYMVRNQR